MRREPRFRSLPICWQFAASAVAQPRDILPPIARVFFSSRSTRARPGVEFPARPRHSCHDTPRKRRCSNRDLRLRIWLFRPQPVPGLRHWRPKAVSPKNSLQIVRRPRAQVLNGAPHELPRKRSISGVPAKAKELILDVLWPLSGQAWRRRKTFYLSFMASSAIPDGCGLAPACERR